MKLPQTLLVGLIAFVGHGTTYAGGGFDDFRLELQWRSNYDYNDFEAAIILYEQSHYRGRSLVLYPGEQIDNFDSYEWGFRVRSVEVVGPVSTVLYDETGLWGHQLDVYRNIPDLRDYRMRLSNYSSFYWHNRARSAYVSYRDPQVSINIHIGPGRILPRIFCARPITPRYYWYPQPKRYHHPRPKWYHDHRKAVPPPRPHTYHKPPGKPPRVTPHTRPPNKPPRTTPPGKPSTRPQTTPPNRKGNPPTARPPTRNDKPNTQAPSRGQSSAPTARPPGRPSSSAPATRAPSTARPTAASKSPSRSAPKSPPPQPSSGSRTAPPPR